MLEFIRNREIYERVICGWVPRAKSHVWLATSDLKDMYVDKEGGKRPFLEVLSDLVKRKVEVRLIHAKEPGAAFRRDFDRYPNLIGGIERILCPRVHFKSVIVDGKLAYTGSANLTGAGIGAKSKDKRNFEAGIVTDEKGMVGEIAEQFDSVWRGYYCQGCKRKQYCADYKELLG
ncbi:MAG: phospholipase D family protein [Planctomycetota bacterium]|nr:MAG: phospholipase D family protein [Planctomycetota bacterium]